MGHTPGDWRVSNRNWRGEPDPHHLYITGDHHTGDYGEECCTAVAIVVGNATAGPMPHENAALIIAAPALLAFVEKWLGTIAYLNIREPWAEQFESEASDLIDLAKGTAPHAGTTDGDAHAG